MSQKQAPGFAAALDRLMAQGGDRKATRRGFTFSQGRLKGKTKDQAVQMGRNMWAGASDAVKEKYAQRERDLQAPSEKAEFAAAMGGGQSRAPMGGGQGASSRGGQSSAPRYAAVQGPSFAELTKAPVVPEGGIKAVGDGSTEGNGWTPQIADPTPSKMPAPGTPVTAGMSTDERMHAQGKTNMGGVPVEKALVDVTKREKSNPTAPLTPEFQGPAVPRINPQTGLPMGYRPGDSVAPAPRAKADESVMNQRIASAPRAVPVAAPAAPSATQRYTDAQNQYQGSQLDPKFAAQMDTIYKGASSLDQAKITAQSMKRASALPTTVNAPRAIPVSNFTGPSTPRRAIARR